MAEEAKHTKAGPEFDRLQAQATTPDEETCGTCCVSLTYIGCRYMI